MNKTIQRFGLLIACFAMATMSVIGQQVGTNSPYGRYGYGELSNPSIGAMDAMGGISYGVRRSQSVNPGNPASYSKIDTLTMVFDFGVSGHLSRLSDGTNSRDFYNGNLDYVAMQFPLFRGVGASVGLLPFSKVGYNFGTTKSLQDVIYQESYRGTGGLNQLYAGLAWAPVKNFSIGANFGFLFGNFQYSNVVTPVTVTGSLLGETKFAYSIRDFKWDIGAQYTIPVDKKSNITLGAVYSPAVKASAVVYPTEMMYNGDPYQNPYISPVQVLKTDTLAAQDFALPHSFGFGFTYSNESWLMGGDATYQLWKGIAYPAQLDNLTDDTRFRNRYKVNAGLEYVKDPMSNRFGDRLRLRGGVSFANSYNNVNVVNPVNNQHIGMGGYKELGVNFGIGLPVRNTLSGHVSMLNIGFGYSKQFPELESMIAQDLFKVSVSMNVNEFWFFKRQFD